MRRRRDASAATGRQMSNTRTAGWFVLGVLAAMGLAEGCVTARDTPDRAYSPDEIVEGGISPQIFLESTEKAVLPAGVEARHVYPPGIEVTASFEGYRRRLYNDAAGFCTIGIGHLVKRAKCDGSEPPGFLEGLDKPAALKLLSDDMVKAEIPTQLMVQVNLSDSQFAALCDFAFNCGTGRLSRSQLLRHINDGELDKVAGQLRRYTWAGGKELPGLVRRRAKEIEMFYEGMPIPKAAPGPEEDLTPVDLLEPEAGG